MEKTGFIRKVTMAQEVQDMAKKLHSNTVFSRLNPAKPGHLKPLSIYSRMITSCGPKASVHHTRKSPNQFINFKIEIVNNCSRKRKLDDYNTPAKRICAPKTSSPDLGCFMDSSISPARQDPVPQKGHRCEKLIVNPAPAFDCDVDDILCLSPFGTCPAGTSTVAQESGRRDGQVKEQQEELKTKKYVKEEEDNGYFSMSYMKDLELGKHSPQSVCPQPPQAASSPLLWPCEVEVPEGKGSPENSSEQGRDKQAAPSGQPVSFNYLCPIISQPLVEPVNSPVEPLEGDVDEVLDIGPPMFESSLCHNVTVKVNADIEERRQVSEEVMGGVTPTSPVLGIHECQTTLSGEETTLGTFDETTLPLQVQVKSVVVALTQRTSSTKLATHPLPEQKAGPTKPSPNESRGSQAAKTDTRARTQRPGIIDSKVNWEREKRLYVHLVTKHMHDNTSTGQDVMTELQSLMTHVADQTPSIDGKQWQHPSDLTRRNYQRRFGNAEPKMSLSEWRAKNYTTHKRFAMVPKIFERSRVP